MVSYYTFITGKDRQVAGNKASDTSVFSRDPSKPLCAAGTPIETPPEVPPDEVPPGIPADRPLEAPPTEQPLEAPAPAPEVPPDAPQEFPPSGDTSRALPRPADLARKHLAERGDEACL